MRDVYVVSVGLIPFGRHYTDDVKRLTARAVEDLFASQGEAAMARQPW